MNTYNFDIGEKCICCNNYSNGYIFCKDCYQNIKDIRYTFDHNRKEENIINQYFKMKNNINKYDEIEDILEDIKFIFALSEELDYNYGNYYLSERIEKDIYNILSNYNERIKKTKSNTITKTKVEKYNDQDYRNKWPREYMCEDGHYVRSLSEQNIDNWLYNNGYLHAYEKSVYMHSQPDAIVLSDFYLPKGKIYIEYWGIDDDDKYEQRKKEKIKLYNENNLNRIDLTKEDIKRLDDIMPRLINKFIKEKK